MGLIKDALRDRREQRKEEERLKREAVEKARATMTFDARLQESMKLIAGILEDGAVERITVEVAEKDLASVTKALYAGKLSEYKVAFNGNVLTFEKEIIEL